MALLPLAAWSTPRDNTYGPADNTAVGATIQIQTSAGAQPGLVTYRVTGWDATNDFYTVKITGLDADGLQTLAAGSFDLEIPLSFREKFGENYYSYAVTAIADGLAADGVTRQSFYGYTEITSLKFVNNRADKVADDNFSYTVGDGAQGKSFYGCTNMSTLEFTENCTSIAQYSFQNTAISNFEIPKNCAAIAAYAFWNCQSLNTVTVASGNTVLTTLADYVFANSALKTLDLTNATNLYTIGTVGNSPFWYTGSPVNNYLKTVKLPANVKNINDSFSLCTALTNIYGLQSTKLGEPANTPTGSPAGTHIINGAFAGCRSLTRLDIPSCDVIDAPFVGCVALDTLTFYNYNDKTIFQGGTAGNNLYGVSNPAAAGYVAADQAALKVVEFVGNVNGDIADNAFVGMTGLTKVEFKGKLQSDTEIGAAFTDVTSLKEVVFNGINSDGVADVVIKANAFKNTGITALDFKGITLQSNNNKDFTIENNAFSNCADLATIDFGAISVTNTGKINIADATAGAFINNPKLTKVTFGAIDFTDAGQLNIANDAFATGNVMLSEVEFGDITTADNKTNQVQIGTTAPVFGDGAKLEKVTFGNVAAHTFTINTLAFKSTGLKEVTFGDITSDKDNAAGASFIIGASAFEGGETSDKEVEFGTIKDNGTTQLTATINQNAFAAKMLKKVTIGDMEATKIDIKANAFANANVTAYGTNNETLLATQNLQSVKLGNITASANGASTFDVAEGAFWGGKAGDKKVEIGTIKDAATGTTGTMTATIAKNAFAAEKLKEVVIGDMAADAITISENAFANKKYATPTPLPDPTTQNLKTVTLGNITASNIADADVDIKAAAFWGGNQSAKVVTIGTIKDKSSTTLHTTSVTIGDDAFVGQRLETVTIGKDGMSATKIEFGENAFSNATKAELAGTVPALQHLNKVTLGNITAGNGASTFEAKKGAFWGGTVASKTVTIGDITDGTAAGATMTATIADQVAEADKLFHVTIGNMTATSVAIGEKAFSGKMLQTVELGDMTATTLTVNDYAFANVNTEEALNESVTIGELKTADFTGGTNKKAFQGPQVDGSSLSVSIKSITGAVKVPANTFVAPAKGIATYIVKGDVAAGALANVLAGSFVGSKNADASKNTTSVKFQGDFKSVWANVGFTNVNDVEIAVAADGAAKDYNPGTLATGIWQFSGAKTFKIGNVVAGNKIAANYPTVTDDIEEITFIGNVAGTIGTFNSTKVRKIDFANVGESGVTVVANAIQAAAFEAAADNAKTVGENISVIYRETTTRDAVNIFNANAFTSTTDDTPVVTLYTTPWAKANIYESTDASLNHKVYRLGFSASDVAPGEDIETKVYKSESMEYAYGKLYIPKGSNMKYKVSAEVTGTGVDAVNNVQLYYGRIDKSKDAIYMHSLPTIDGYYWIDATDVDQAFMVRTKGKADGTVITAEPVTEEEDALFAADTDGDYVYFDANFAKYNQFRYNTQKISNQNLNSDAEFLDKEVYALANPRTDGFSFNHVNKATNSLPAKSLYIVGKVSTAAGRVVNIIFDDEMTDETVTGIENVNVDAAANAESADNAEIYNLNGVRVNSSAKGIIIKNGKKYFNK